jgi:DegV family protein with EDD domain
MVKIISDSTCDLSPEIIKEYDIAITPLFIISSAGDGEQEFRDKVDIQPADLFKMVEVDKKICRTAAVNVFDYEKIFEEYSSKYDAVILINISRGFSACHQNAKIAAADFGNVYVVDSRNLSTGQGYLVHDAAIMAKEGKPAQKILDYLEKAAPFMNCSFIIDRLDYLHRGGRCSLAKLIATRMLNIKPCIEVCEGVMRVGAKYKGDFETVLEKYVDDRLTELIAADNIDFKRVYITHPMCNKETVDLVYRKLEKLNVFGEIIETCAGCTVSNHCGPNTLGIIFQQKSEYK